MTEPMLIRDLFANDIDRNIEEVIKVDQRDEQIVVDEISEYVVTDSIRGHYAHILERYLETPNKPHEGIGVWVSGFYGSGKSSFAKMLGLAIQNHPLGGVPAARRFEERAGDPKLTVVLDQITERIPTHAVIFDVSTDRGIRSGNQTLTEIAYSLLLQSLGYAKDLDLSELEITLEGEGRLTQFEDTYRRTYEKEWSAQKSRVAFAIAEASRVMQELDPTTYPSADSWSNSAMGRNDITPGLLAKRAVELMARRRPNQALLFVIDEVGQFVARDVQKMLDLQAIVQNLGTQGRGRLWMVVTSQERLGELVSGLDDKRVEHARLMDRFSQQVHLSPTDISEVTSRRVLAKNAAAQAALGELFEQHRVRLTEHTRVSADIKLPELDRKGFIDLYPLLPYQIELIINIVSGLRTQGGTERHVGGANRTIIKLAQQLLINPQVRLADKPLGDLVTLDQVYDLQVGNIASEVRAKIEAIPSQLRNPHPLALSVAEAICLLQYVKSVHRKAEDIAACLHPHVAADSQLASVNEALRQLEEAHLVRRGDDGYRIPTASEDDWERVRNGAYPRPGDAHRIYQEVIGSLWEPQPSHSLLGIKAFKGGLAFRGREVTAGDITFQIHLAEDPGGLEALANDLRARSRDERKDIFWAAALDSAIDQAMVELHRSRTVIEVKEREARTQTESALVAEERRRRDGHLTELKKRLSAALVAGNVFFRGNERSPGEGAADVAKAASSILGEVTPQIFERFGDAAAKTADAKRGLDDLLKADSLRGLPAVFSTLHLLQVDQGETTFAVTRPPLKEILDRIQSQHDYGQAISGLGLTEAFAKEPFGWEFEVVRLLVLCLLRGEHIVVTSKGQTIEAATGPLASDAFSNNPIFRQATFRPRQPIDFGQLVDANNALKSTFGVDAKELTQSAIVMLLRERASEAADRINDALFLLSSNGLPGVTALQAGLEPLKAIARGSEENAIAEFNGAHGPIKDALTRASEILDAIAEPQLTDLARARTVLGNQWPAISEDPDLPESLQQDASNLTDLLARETFYRELPSIDQAASRLSAEFGRRHGEALAQRVSVYRQGIEDAKATPGWGDLDPDTQAAILAPLEKLTASVHPSGSSIQQLRSDTQLAESRITAAQHRVVEILAAGRLAVVSLKPYFAGGIETEEQLEAALAGIREEVAKLIGEGKKVVVG